MIQKNGIYELPEKVIYVIRMPNAFRYDLISKTFDVWKIGKEPGWFWADHQIFYRRLEKNTVFNLEFVQRD
jgi:hypothetical protein